MPLGSSCRGQRPFPTAPQEHPDRAFLGLSCRPLATSWGRPGALLGRPEILPGDLSGALFVPSQQFLGICRVALLELPRFLGPRRLGPARARVEVPPPPGCNLTGDTQSFKTKTGPAPSWASTDGEHLLDAVGSRADRRDEPSQVRWGGAIWAKPGRGASASTS